MARFYKYPLNYGPGRTTPDVCSDNDYNTMTTMANVSCLIDSKGDGTGSPTEFTSFFFKGKNIATINVIPQGSTTGFGGIAIEASGNFDKVVNDSNEEVSITVDGYQNILYDLQNPTKENAASLNFRFVPISGQTAEVSEVLVLDEIVRFDKQRSPEIDIIDLGGEDSGVSGRVFYVPPINGERDRWRCTFDPIGSWSPARDTRAKIEELRLFFRNNKEFTCAIEPNRYPEFVAPAKLEGNSLPFRFLHRNKRLGRSLRFTVREL